MKRGVPVHRSAARVLDADYDRTALDPGTFVASAVVFAAVSMLAAFVAARRATRVDALIAYVSSSDPSPARAGMNRLVNVRLARPAKGEGCIRTEMKRPVKRHSTMA